MGRSLTRPLIVAVILFGTIAVAPISLLGQWPAHPTEGVPRTTDGKADLAAPAPRTAEGKPDLTGVWNYAGVLGFRGGPPPSPPGTPPEATFWNIEAGIKEGLPFRPWAAELRKQRMTAESKDNPDAACLPLDTCSVEDDSQGSHRHHLRGQRRCAQIFLDGRPSGYSDDTLVVTHFRDLGWLDVNGAPLTAEGKIIERFRRPNFGRLEIDVTIDDPKAYTKPWTVRVNQRLLVDTDLIEFVCLENEKFSSQFRK